MAEETTTRKKRNPVTAAVGKIETALEGLDDHRKREAIKIACDAEWEVMDAAVAIRRAVTAAEDNTDAARRVAAWIERIREDLKGDD